jgi:hypothetical protein
MRAGVVLRVASLSSDFFFLPAGLVPLPLSFRPPIRQWAPWLQRLSPPPPAVLSHVRMLHDAVGDQGRRERMEREGAAIAPIPAAPWEKSGAMPQSGAPKTTHTPKLSRERAHPGSDHADA